MSSEQTKEEDKTKIVNGDGDENQQNSTTDTSTPDTSTPTSTPQQSSFLRTATESEKQDLGLDKSSEASQK
jgi:hypothetical protein